MAVLTFPTPTQLKNLLGPTANTDAATKAYVDSGGAAANTGNITFSNANISSNLANADLSIIGNGIGNVTVTANTSTWVFGADGNITLPANTFSFKYANGDLVSIANANYANFAGQVVDNSQPNITSVGNLNGLSINGDLYVSGNANIQGTLTYNSVVNLGTSNLVLYLANNKTGSNTNGAGISVGNTEEATFLYDYSNNAWVSNIAISANGNVSGANITTTGNLTTGNLSVTGVSNLGSASNVLLGGGLSGQAIVTDGNGNLSWSSSVVQSLPLYNGTSNIDIPVLSGNVNFSVSGVPNVLVVGSSNVTVNGQLTSTNKIVSNSEIAISSYSGASEGGQLTLAYKGVSVTGQTNGTWYMDVDSSNNFRLVNQDASGGTLIPMSVDPASGNITLANNLNATSGGLYASRDIVVSGNGTIANNLNVGNLTVSGNANATGTVTASIIAANTNGTGNNFKVGDDAWIGDINQADTLQIKGQANAANGYIVFGDSDTTKLGRAGTGPLTYGGPFTATGSIGAGDKLFANGYGLIMNSTSGASEGPQIVMAYKGVSGLTSESNSTWNIDVDSANNMRIYSVDFLGTANINTTFYPDGRVQSITPRWGSLYNTGSTPEITVDDWTFGVFSSLNIKYLGVKSTGGGSQIATWGTVTSRYGAGPSGSNGAQVTFGSGYLRISDAVDFDGAVVEAIITNNNTNVTYRVTLARLGTNNWNLVAERLL